MIIENFDLTKQAERCEKTDDMFSACEKVTYDTEREAKRAAKYYNIIERKKGRRSKGQQKPYPCPRCNKYHLTTG